MGLRINDYHLVQIILLSAMQRRCRLRLQRGMDGLNLLEATIWIFVVPLRRYSGVGVLAESTGLASGLAFFSSSFFCAAKASRSFLVFSSIFMCLVRSFSSTSRVSGVALWAFVGCFSVDFCRC